jgi:hypothetical protein
MTPMKFSRQTNRAGGYAIHGRTREAGQAWTTQ